MKMLYHLIIASLINATILVSLTSCSHLLASKMPKGSVSMEQAYNQAINGSDDTSDNNSLPSIRATVKPQSAGQVDYRPYTRTQKNEINTQFPTLPNPSVVMYIFPHQAGSGDHLTPIPGYATVFPLYEHVYYAMPGEITYRNSR